MLEQFNYRFTSARRLRERGNVKGLETSPEGIEQSNDAAVDRLKHELELHEDSRIADLRKAVRKLARD